MALDFFAGCLGGAAGVIVGHPLDTVKVRLQTQSPTNIKYKGTFHCLTTIVKQESVSGLYKGISSPLFGVAGVNALIFGVYGALRPYVGGYPGNDALWAHFAAGSISGAVQSVIASPMELVKTRLQISEDLPGVKKQGPIEVLKGIYRNEGGLFRGVFKGWNITLAREIPGFGFYFASYEALTRFGDGQVGTLGMMLAGGMAGVISWIVTFPIDVVKTRLQCDSSGKYKGILDCVRKTYGSEGHRAFTRGLVSTVIRAFPTNAATFTVVTWVMRLAETTPEDEIQSSKKYMEELLNKTTQIQEKMEESLRLKVPNYFLCGNSLTSCSLASQCATSAQKYANNTQVYFNFYQSLQDQIQEETQFNQGGSSLLSPAESVDQSHQDKNVKLSLRDGLQFGNKEKGSQNMQNQENLIFVSSSSSGSISRSNISLAPEEDVVDEENENNRNCDNAVLQNNHNHIYSESHIKEESSLSRKSTFERENNANPVNTISSFESIAERDRNTENDNDRRLKNSSLVHGNGGFSHEATPFPAAASDVMTGVCADYTEGEQRNVAESLDSNIGENIEALSSGDLNYLSKTLDIPAHIVEAAVAQQNHKNKAKENNTQYGAYDDKKKVQKKSLSAPKDCKKNAVAVAQAWRNYCSNYNTPAAAAMSLCKCFEDHCVCYF